MITADRLNELIEWHRHKLDAGALNLTADTMTALLEVERLRRFAVGMLYLCPHTDCEGVQELALQQGVLVEVMAIEPCDPEQCSCAEYGDFPMQCYRLAPELQP